MEAKGRNPKKGKPKTKKETKAEKLTRKLRHIVLSPLSLFETGSDKGTQEKIGLKAACFATGSRSVHPYVDNAAIKDGNRKLKQESESEPTARNRVSDGGELIEISQTHKNGRSSKKSASKEVKNVSPTLGTRVQKLSRSLKNIALLPLNLLKGEHRSESENHGGKAAYFAAGSKVEEGKREVKLSKTSQKRPRNGSDRRYLASDLEIRAISILLEKETALAKRKGLSIEKNMDEDSHDFLIRLRKTIRAANDSVSCNESVSTRGLVRSAERVVKDEIEELRAELAKESAFYYITNRKIREGIYDVNVTSSPITTSTPFQDMKRILIAMAKRGLLKDGVDKDSFISLVKFLQLESANVWPRDEIQDFLECFKYAQPAEFFIISNPNPSVYAGVIGLKSEKESDVQKTARGILISYDVEDVAQLEQNVLAPKNNWVDWLQIGSLSVF